MKHILRKLLLIVIISSCQQVEKQTQNVTKSEQTATGTLKVICGVEGELLIDGESKGQVSVGEVKKLELKSGEYYVQLKPKGGGKVVIVTVHIESGKDKLLELTTEGAKKTEKVMQENSIVMGDIPMVYVEGGTFKMGCTSEQDNCFDKEKPIHSVTLSSYNIGKYEVTQAQWTAIMGANPSIFSGCDNCPVDQVSWDMTQAFIRKLNEKTGLKYRLPTEAEWEYAARGGNKSRGYKYAGSNEIGLVAWHDENSGGKAHPVGQKMANELGVYDMAGNVSEWCSDLYGHYSSSSQINPKGTNVEPPYRCMRGGAWSNADFGCRIAFRYSFVPDFSFHSYGLRLVLIP